MKANIIETTPEKFQIDPAFRINLSEEEIREGLLSFREFLKLYFDVIAADNNLYDITLIEEPREIATIAQGYPFLGKLSHLLNHLGIHGELINDTNKYLVMECKKLNSVIKKVKVKQLKELLIYLSEMGFLFDGLELKDKKFDFTKQETFRIFYPDNDTMLVGLKLISMAQVNLAGKCYNTETGTCSAGVENIFLRCDYHTLENAKVKTHKMYIRECLNSLTPEMATYITELDILLTENNCKNEGDPGNFKYAFTYTSKKTKKVVCKIAFGITGCSIKLNAEHINEYLNFITKLPTDMLDIMKNGWNCAKAFDINGCNPKCQAGFKFKIDGTEYLKCRCLNFNFSINNATNREIIKKWFELEMSYA
jgi:hypothetical protein